VEDGGGDPEQILHGTHFVLGGAGSIRGFYDTEDADLLEALEADLRALAR
jgi:hypothetical protein